MPSTHKSKCLTTSEPLLTSWMQLGLQLWLIKAAAGTSAAPMLDCSRSERANVLHAI